jgi:hypothetical protein
VDALHLKRINPFCSSPCYARKMDFEKGTGKIELKFVVATNHKPAPNWLRT